MIFFSRNRYKITKPITPLLFLISSTFTAEVTLNKKGEIDKQIEGDICQRE